MESPFTDFIAEEATTYTDHESDLMFESPFTDPAQTENENYFGYETDVIESAEFDKETRPSAVTPSRWHQFIKGTTRSHAVPLVYGKETFEAIVKAIKTATAKGHYIYILGWMIDVDFPLIEDKPDTSLRVLLKNAADKGAEVRVLIWDNPDYRNQISVAQKMISQLGNAKMFKDNVTYGSTDMAYALKALKLITLTAPPALRLLDGWNKVINYSNLPNEGSHHEKIIIVKGGDEKGKDELTAFCGGIDLNPNRITGIDGLWRSKVLHDVHCQLKDHAAWELLQRFIWRCDKYSEVKNVTITLEGRKEKEPAPVSHGADVSNVKIIHTFNQQNGKIIDRSIRDTVEIAIKNAKRTIHIEDQYMLSLEIAKLINHKLLHEPDFESISILTQDDEFAREDIRIIKRMRKEFIDTLCQNVSPQVKEKKVKLWILNPHNRYPALNMVHSKMYIIDGELTIIGSANCSRRSMTHDTETAAVIFNDNDTRTNFVNTIQKKYGKLNTWVPYVPNPGIKDLDEEIIEDAEKIVHHPANKIFFPALPLVAKKTDIVRNNVARIVPLLRRILDPYDTRTLVQKEYSDATESTGFGNEIDYENVEETLVHDMENYALMEQGDVETESTELECKHTEHEWEEEAPDLSLYEQDKDVVDNEMAEVIEQQVAVANSSSAKSCEGHTCWAKGVLNQLLGLSLTPDNRLDEQTKKAIETFQANNNLTQTQKVDAVTERTLLEADALHRHKGTVSEQASMGVISTAKTKIEDWTKQAVNNKPQHILNHYRDPRKIFALVLHHMAFKRKSRKTNQLSDPNSYLATGAHFCIMLDGRIIQLHPFSRMIWHSNCTSPRSVGVEFEGNFPNIKGTWWIDRKSTIQNKDNPTQAQYEAGRFLISYLKIVLGTTHILAHRQSSKDRENDPGPDIWYNVGQWAIDKLGLKDTTGFKCGDGNPILPQWRTWGSKVVPAVTPEYNEAYDEETGSGNDETETGYREEPETNIDSYELDYYEPEEEAYAPEFENYTLAYRLDKVRDWVHLLGFKVPDDILSGLKARKMSVQYAHNESYSNDLNVDFYRLRILKYPTVNGVLLNAASLIRYIRLNINSLIDTSLCDFHPYSSTIDKPIWNSDNPRGAVLKLDIKGPDNAAVVVSLSKPAGWRFSTVRTPDTGAHPVSGHREFFIAKDPSTGGSYFVVKGLDMMSTGVAGLGFPVMGEYGFGQAHQLWISLRKKVIQFINANGGQAKEDMTYSERVEWRFVYYRYKNLLADTFGKGAGSAEKSSFFD